MHGLEGRSLFMQESPTLMQRALGAYLGLAAGDALGATVEFMTAREIAAIFKVHRHMVGGGWLRLKVGQVTDDTEMALALGEALLRGGVNDTRVIADSYVKWMQSCPVDIGNTCRRGIRRYMLQGTIAAEPAPDSAGNGAAMRNLPVILATLDDEISFERLTLEQAHITHNHPLSDAAVLTVGRMTRRLLRGEGMQAARAEMILLVEVIPDFKFDPWPGNTSGYIVDTVQTVMDALFTTNSFESCLLKAVNRGGDADTTGALAGQLAGALYGIDSIPQIWLNKLDRQIQEAVRGQTAGLLAIHTREPAAEVSHRENAATPFSMPAPKPSPT
ncbi:MAG: ADP-ribosyl-[dinitrogen reductase] hydrolase [Nibricoccus sp.]